MNVIVVDDERIILLTETAAVKKVLPEANVNSFQKAQDALTFAAQNKVDIAFLDINMEVVTGLQLAKKLEDINPKTNIIFCTGYSEYSMEALDLYCSAYIMKPVTEKKLQDALARLRYPIEDSTAPALQAQCFGNFELFCNGVPVKFKYGKSKELFAYLIDRRGATVSTKEMAVNLFEEDEKESYVRNLRCDMKASLEDINQADVLVYEGTKIGINLDKIQCDFYDYLKGNKKLFLGEYMSQYSFAEETLAWLLKEDME